MLGRFSAITMVLNGLSLSNVISSQGFFTVGLAFLAVPKLSSLAKSLIHMSSLQLELAGWRFAILVVMIGSCIAGSLGRGPLLFHCLPISCNVISALSSINPSGLGATFRMKLQKALLSGIMFSFTRVVAVLTASVGKDVFQNQALLMGKQERAG